MVNRLWHFAVLALIVVVASHQTDADIETDAHKVADLTRTFERKVKSSFPDVAKATEGMMVNLLEYIMRYLKQRGDDASEYVPHFKEFYDAITSRPLKKLFLDCMRTLLSQTQHHCGKVHLEHNPVHPGLQADVSRSKRSTERMTLAKFGESLSTWMTVVDKATVDYVTKAAPIACSVLEEGLKGVIQHVQRFSPEDFKNIAEESLGLRG